MSTIVTVRPSGSIFFGQTQNSPTIATMSDNNDGTFAWFGAFDPDLAFVTTDMADNVLAGNQRCAAIRSRARIKVDVGSSPATLFLSLIVNGSTLQDFGWSNAAGNAQQEIATSYSVADFSQTQLNTIQVECRSFGTTQWKISEHFADLEIRTQPTITVTSTPGQMFTNPQPTFTWTYNDQGDTISRHRVKVFRKSVVLGGGFDPETSTSVWDSGNVAGAATSKQVGTPLYSDDYYFYAKTATDYLGSDWFSSWSSVTFSISAVADMPAAGDLASTATSSSNGVASMAGVGDLSAFASIPAPCGAMGYSGGWYGGLSVYGGFGYCAAITPIDPPQSAITSNVVDIDDSVGRLGCGEPSFFITNRCTSGVNCVLDGLVTAAKWSRALDDVSTAEVTVDLSGDTSFVCCQCLAETEPWCHELHIWRDGEEVWVGPVQEIEYSYNQVIVRASDSLAWLGVRIPIVHVNPAVAEDITTTAINAINLAFNEEIATYSCEVDNIFSSMTGVVIKLFYEAYHDTYLEILRKISSVGLNFTTVGRTIVLAGSTTPLTPLVLLNDEHIIGDIKVTKDGTLQGNRYYVHFEGDSGVPTVARATNFYCYNAIERLLDGLGLVTGAQAFATASSYAAASAISPRMVVVPPGSRLSPDTPWTINQMVPGARVDVAVTRLCLDLTQSFILTGVTVSYDANGESVEITLTPINNSPTS